MSPASPRPATSLPNNGTAPIEVSSGDLKRHRLSRLGDRQLNRALYVAALCQIRHDTAGRAYTAASSASPRRRRRLSEASSGSCPTSCTATSSPTSDRPRPSVLDPRSVTTRRRWPANPHVLLGSLA